MQRKKLWQKEKENLNIREISNQNEMNKEMDNETTILYTSHMSIKINL